MSTFRSQQGSTVARMDILPPEHAQRSRAGSGRRGEVVDAKFVTVPETSRRSSHNDNHGCTRPNLVVAGSQSYLQRALEAGEKALMGLSADFFSAVVAAVFVIVFALAGGFSFFFAGTDTAEAGAPLDITHVTMTPQDANGMRVLLINGIVENRTESSLTMPPIRADLISGDKVVATTLIAPPAHAIAAGRSRGFTARVPHPGGKLPDLRVSLTHKGV